MDDPPKNPYGVLQNHEPVKNLSLKIKWKSSKAINGFCKGESRIQVKDHNLELKSYKGKLKNHIRSPSIDQKKGKDARPAANDESVHVGNLKIDRETTTCSVCGRVFPSRKSLYGHMRSHPDRLWRGINPPHLVDSTIVEIDDQQKNLIFRSGGSGFDKSLNGWSKTRKRGWNDVELEAAEGLLILVNGNSLDLVKKNKDRNRVTEDAIVAIEDNVQVLDLQMKRQKEGSEPGKPEFQCKKPKVQKENEKSRAGLIPELIIMDSGMEIPNEFEEFVGNNIEVDQVENTYLLYGGVPSNCMPFKSKILMKKFCELGKMNYNETPVNPNTFDCTICHKSFPSYQALGGHKSGHNKDYKNSIQKADVEDFSSVDARNQPQVDESQDFYPSSLKNKSGTHQCKICNKTFLTGQALGGHQTLHRSVGPTAAPISSFSTSEQINKGSPTSSFSSPEKISKESSSSSVQPLEKIMEELSISSVVLLEEVGTNTNCKRIELDLNELPPPDECF